MPFSTVIHPRYLTPFQALRSLQAEFERAFDAPHAVPIELFAKDDALLLRTALPGVRAEDVHLEVEGDRLTLSGAWPAEPDEGAGAQHVERPRGRFRRTLQLPFEVDATRVQARLERGLLVVQLPRSEASKPVAIPIRTETTQNKGN